MDLRLSALLSGQWVVLALGALTASEVLVAGMIFAIVLVPWTAVWINEVLRRSAGVSVRVNTDIDALVQSTERQTADRSSNKAHKADTYMQSADAPVNHLPSLNTRLNAARFPSSGNSNVIMLSGYR